MKCRSYKGGRYGRFCPNSPTWLIGTARVPYCDGCAARYPVKTGWRVIPRERITNALRAAPAAGSGEATPPSDAGKDAEDAKRYRWLRREDELIGAEPFICRRNGDAFTRWTGIDADSAIDAAIAAAPAEGVG